MPPSPAALPMSPPPPHHHKGEARKSGAQRQAERPALLRDADQRGDSRRELVYRAVHDPQPGLNRLW